MAYPRKYLDRLTTAVNIERKKKELLDLLKIELTYAVNFGADVLISDAIQRGKNICPEALVLYKDLNEIQNTEIKEYIRLQKEAESVLTTIRNEVKLQEKPKTLNEFFNENILAVFPPEKFKIYEKYIFDAVAEQDQRLAIQELLNEAGVLNGQKTSSTSHSIIEVYNWLIEVRRGAN